MDEVERGFVIPGGEAVVNEQPRDTSPVVLRYVAKYGEFVFGVPARDLTQADMDARGLTMDELLEYAGVYERAYASPRESDD